MNPPRSSPLHQALSELAPVWGQINQMPVARDFAPSSAGQCSRLAIGDHSALTRFGVKGPHAAAWLADHGVTLPTLPNSWLPIAGGARVARLGVSEYFIEDGEQSAFAPLLTRAASAPPPGVYPVLRQDAALVLIGSALPDLLLQTCSVNVAALDLRTHPVLLTSMVGVGVLAIMAPTRDGTPALRLWCDAAYGDYLWRTLLGIVCELGGAAAGFDYCRSMFD